MRQQLRKRDKGAILVIGTAALVMIVPMIGMAIDTETFSSAVRSPMFYRSCPRNR